MMPVLHPSQDESARACLLARGLLPVINAHTARHFLTCAKEGDREAVRAYLALGMPVDVRDENNQGTALIRAAEGNHPEIIRDLVESGADLNARDKDDDTALLTAVNWGHLEALRTLVELGADIHAVSRKSGTPLISAINKGKQALFKALLQAGADVNAPYGAGHYTPLYYTLVTDAPNPVSYTVPLILAGADVDARVGPHHRPLLSYAIIHEKEESAKALIAAGADLNAADDLGWTPWRLANYMGWAPWRGRQFLGWDWPAETTEQGAPPDWRSEVLTAGSTGWVNWRKYLAAAEVKTEFPPEHDLLQAAQSGDVEALQAALDAGAAIDAGDPDGDTALALACYKGQVAAVRHLLQAGAATTPPTPGNGSPLMFAVNAGSLPCVEALLAAGAAPAHVPNGSPLAKAAQKAQLDMVKALIAAGADLDAGDTRGQTALHWAAGKENLALLDLLIAAGAALDVQAHSGATPLKIAVGNRKRQAVFRLLKAGAGPDVPDNLGETPLYTASLKGDAQMVTHLLAAGAHPALPNARGSFPLTIARSMKKEACVEQLVAALTHGPFTQTLKTLNLKAASDPATLPADFYIQLAGRSHPLSLVEWARQAETATVAGLLQAGLPPDTRDGYGETALMVAARARDLATVQVLLKAGADVTARSNTGSTALHKAAYGGHVRVIQALLEAGADPNQGDQWRHTPMHAAAEGGFPEALAALYAGGGQVDPDPVGDTPLMRAARFDRTPALLWLIEAGAALDVRNARLETALSLAVQKRNAVHTAHLLDAGADPDLPGQEGRTPLMQAAGAGELEIVRLLLRAGADPELTDALGRTARDLAAHRQEIAAVLSAATGVEAPTLPLRPVDLPPKPALHRAAQRGDLAQIRRLLAQGVDPDARNARGDTALMLAAERGHTALVHALLEAGADVNAENQVQENAWVLAATLKQEETEAALQAAGAAVDVDRMLAHMARLETLQDALRDGSLAQVRQLLASGQVDIDGLAASRQSPLIMAAYHGDEPLARLLLAAGADPDLPNLTGHTPLMVAARGNHLALARLLIEAGVTVDAAAPSGATALLLAAGEGNPEVVACLLDAGADPGQSDRDGITPLMQAVAAGSEEIVRLLVKRHADLHARDREGLSAVDWATLGEQPALAERLQRAGGPRPRAFLSTGVQTRATLLEQIREQGLGQHVEALSGVVRPAIRLIPSNHEDDPPLGASRLGGRPDLPPGVAWPVVEGVLLEFVGQFWLADLAPLDVEGVLPEQGMLYFFFDGMLTGYDRGAGQDRQVVLYYDGPRDALERRAVPAHDYGHRFRVYRSRALLYESAWALPPLEEIDDNEATCIPPVVPILTGQEARSAYRALRQRDFSHQLLGHPAEVQGGEMRLTLVTAQDTAGRFASDAYGNYDHRDELIAEMRRWRLLAQFATEGATGMDWGCGGMIYFWIREQDLADRRFDRVYGKLEST